jgi:hypothetical protein
MRSYPHIHSSRMHPARGRRWQNRAVLRRSVTCVISVVVAAVLAESAVAAIGPAFSRPRARVGEALSVFQPGGLSWFHGDGRPIRIYLVRASVVSRVIGSDGTAKKGPPPSRLVTYIGTWSRKGRLTFRVPHVTAGRYAAVAWCLPCGGTLVGSVPWSVPNGVAMRPDGSLLTIRT